MPVMSASCGEPRLALAMGQGTRMLGGDLGGSGSMSAGCVTDWEWPRVKGCRLVALVTPVEESSGGDADGDLRDVRGGS
jgi:hypothetical protein